MHTETDFRRKINRSPKNWTARLIFADWLEQRGDPRAEGYRVMARMKLQPVRSRRNEGYYWHVLITGRSFGNHIKEIWFSKMPTHENGLQRKFASRGDAEDALALAYFLLAAEERLRV